MKLMSRNIWRTIIISSLFISGTSLRSVSAQESDFLTLCGGGIGALPTPWTPVDGGIAYTSGRVGIGTTQPSSELEVNGMIKAEELELDGLLVKALLRRLQQPSAVETVVCSRASYVDLSAECPAGKLLLSCSGTPGDLDEDHEGWFVRPDFENRRCLMAVQRPQCTGTPATSQRLTAYCF